MLQQKSGVQRIKARSYAPGGFQSVLVALDLSTLSERVMGRVALLPLAEGARVTLLHVLSRSLTSGQREAEQRARRALEAQAASLRPSLPLNASIELVVKVGTGASDIAACAEETNADLTVVGRGSRNLFRDTFLGSTAERVVRRARRAVLVVRLPAGAPYRRPVLAIDTDEAAREAVMLLLRAIPPPRPIVSVIHACDSSPEEPPEPGLGSEPHAQRDDQQRQLARVLSALLTSAVARAKVANDDAPWWLTHVRHGSPRAVIKEDAERCQADLLVLGTRGLEGVAHLFMGTVAGDVLRDVACDVLVAPHPREDSGAAGSPGPTRHVKQA
jgi:nucleotide-binding universal stress UspA family protein